ncbi:tetratricopeptide repeat protein [Myxococcota bacterium]|nr:tetratricopeptide repeat protein [Myxococcota bacterium]
MAEGRQQHGAHMQARLGKLVKNWSEGRVSLSEIFGLSTEELHNVASQGYFLFLQGRTEPARVIFEGLVAVDPRNAYYYRALGVIYWRLGEAQKAVKQFTYAIRVSPGDLASYVNRAEVYVANQRYKEAETDLNHVLDKAKSTDRDLVKKTHAILVMLR